MTGRIHSVESFGTVDGPGIRYVLFMQGCPLRCLYCHNPDTWDLSGGREITVQEVLSEYNKNRDFYAKGGITVTGGEPLLQVDFLTELFKAAKSENIHTCIDTSGITFNPESTDKIDNLLQYTDLVMLDIKHIDNDEHTKLTGKSNKNILQFAKHLEKLKKPVWVRHIIVENITDNPEHLKELGRFIGSLKNLAALDVLPYHTMGVNKYKELNIPYALEGVPALPLKEAVKAKQHILNGIYEVKKR